MLKRTTIEIDDELLARAKRALGETTARATVEEALRRVADAIEELNRSGKDRVAGIDQRDLRCPTASISEMRENHGTR